MNDSKSNLPMLISISIEVIRTSWSFVIYVVIHVMECHTVITRAGVNSGIGIGIDFNSNSNSGIGIGIGIASHGIGIGIGIDRN